MYIYIHTVYTYIYCTSLKKGFHHNCQFPRNDRSRETVKPLLKHCGLYTVDRFIDITTPWPLSCLQGHQKPFSFKYVQVSQTLHVPIWTGRSMWILKIELPPSNYLPLGSSLPPICQGTSNLNKFWKKGRNWCVMMHVYIYSIRVYIYI